MKSMPGGDNNNCKKEKHEKECPTIIKCSCPSSTLINVTASGTVGEIASDTIASLYLDTSCLCDPKVKLEFATNYRTDNVFTGNISIQVFKQCDEYTRLPVGSAWNSSILPSVAQIITFFICDSDFCKDRCCLYTVVATVSNIGTGSMTVTFNNSTISVIATCDSNECKSCN